MTSVNIERRPDPKAELGYVCPECKAWSPVGLWKETEVCCEDCGTHQAMRCPLCEEDHDGVYVGFEDADQFLAEEARKRGSTPAQQERFQRDRIQSLEAFLASADERAKAAQAEAAAARKEAGTVRAAWLQAVGARLLWRPDVVTALAETTTDMRIRLDELDEEAAGCRLSAMVAEYGPFVPSEVEEAA